MDKAARHLFLYCLLSPATCLYTPFQEWNSSSPFEIKLAFITWHEKLDKNSFPWLVLPRQSAPFWLVPTTVVTLNTKIQAKIHSPGHVKLLSPLPNYFHCEGLLADLRLALTLLLSFMVTVTAIWDLLACHFAYCLFRSSGSKQE